MKQKTASASKIIHAPSAIVYEILADYRTKHPLILPKPYFRALEVEEGGFGAGTLINFSMQILGRTQAFRSLITEPVPGQVLLERDLNSGVSTQFDVRPLENDSRTRVTISTELKNQGALERVVARLLLQRIYRQELELLAKFAEHHAMLAHTFTIDRAR